MEKNDYFRREQASISETSGIRYPLMKLIYMYIRQIGYEKCALAP
jgi:hypothetical protein